MSTTWRRAIALIDRVEVAEHAEAQRRAVELDVLHARQALEVGDADRPREAHGDVAVGAPAHVLAPSSTVDQPALADDADAVADPLDLVELVRGEEHGGAALALLGDDGQELLLHQRIEPGGGLVEDQQLGLVEERLDQADLLAVAARQLAQRARQVGLEALGERLRAPQAVHAPQRGEAAAAARAP